MGVRGEHAVRGGGGGLSRLLESDRELTRKEYEGGETRDQGRGHVKLPNSL